MIIGICYEFLYYVLYSTYLMIYVNPMYENLLEDDHS